MCKYCLNIQSLDDYRAIVTADLSLGIAGDVSINVGLIPDLVNYKPCLGLTITTDTGEVITRSKEIQCCPVCGKELTGLVSKTKK